MNAQPRPDWLQSAITSLLKALYERDPYTYGHCVRVSQLARFLAEKAGFSHFEQEATELASLFHDLGKIGISDSILLKPGKLTLKEEKIMREHPVKSFEILTPFSNSSIFEAALPGVLHHHERIDGRGYPFGLKNEEIPMQSRLILIVDTFDAMTSTRPYRKGLPTEIAYKELELFSGRQFDPQMVKIFIDAHKSSTANEIFAKSSFLHNKEIKKAA